MITYKGRLLGWQVFFYVSLMLPFPFLILEKEEIFPGSGVHKNTTLKTFFSLFTLMVSKSPPSIHPTTHAFFIHPSNKYLLSTYSVPSTVLDTTFISTDKRDQVPTHVGIMSQLAGGKSFTNMICVISAMEGNQSSLKEEGQTALP